MQVYPEGWQPNLHTPCYLIVGNWLDGTVEEFMTSNNIRLIVRASGQAGDAYKPPGKEYGVNALVEFGRPWVPRQAMGAKVNVRIRAGEVSGGDQ